MIEAKIAIVISAGKKPAVPEIFYTAKEWKLLGIIYSTNLRNGPEIETKYSYRFPRAIVLPSTGLPIKCSPGYPGDFGFVRNPSWHPLQFIVNNEVL